MCLARPAWRLEAVYSELDRSTRPSRRWPSGAVTRSQCAAACSSCRSARRLFAKQAASDILSGAGCASASVVGTMSSTRRWHRMEERAPGGEQIEVNASPVDEDLVTFPAGSTICQRQPLRSVQWPIDLVSAMSMPSSSGGPDRPRLDADHDRGGRASCDAPST